MKAKIVDGALEVEILPNIWVPKACPFQKDIRVGEEQLYAKCGFACPLFIVEEKLISLRCACHPVEYAYDQTIEYSIDE